MKFEVLQENLAASISQTLKFVSPKAQLPILGNILIEAKAGILKFVATDLENGISITAGAKIEEEGAVAVPAKIFAEYVMSLSPGKIDIVEKEGTLEIVSGKNAAKMATSPADEFPKIEEAAKLTKFFSMPQKTIAEIAERLSFCVSTDLVSKPAMTGVYFDNRERILKVVATDGFRLSILETKGGEQDFVLNLPVRPVEEAAKMAEKEGKDVEFFTNKEKTLAVLKIDGTEIFARTIEGKYPPYEKIIPTGFETKFKVDRDLFLKTLKLASVFAKDTSNIVRFQIKDGNLLLFSQTANLGENRAEVDIEKEGADLEISFNCHFALDIVSRLNGKLIVFESGGAGKPGVFKDPDSKNFLHLVMPVKSG